ncbi:hypothetical protein [Azospirillum picis]|uniref:Uncharacterized protein n=1 Tax=Azospirillum picis TaxID=488438 RepID=A0ABU0MUN1_9PROT|nr:hypothetical protein [Azospirillum picis]MBP2303331.1 hypothetical protein [Azospirillum picis]MDQ0537187.1 hypothetical protein [Azospirillum picis]
MARADHCLFLFDNLVDKATVTASRSAVSDEGVALDPSCVQSLRPSEFWRGAGPIEHLQADFGSPVPLSHVMVLAHNLGVSDGLRIRVGNDEGLTDPIDDRTVPPWETNTPFGFGPFGINLGGAPQQASAGAPGNALVTLPAPRAARYLRVDLDRQAGGTVQVGRLFAGLGRQPERNFALDYEWEWVDAAEHLQPNGDLFINSRSRVKYRLWRLTLPGLAESEAFSWWDDLARDVARSADLVVVLFPGRADKPQARTIIHGVPTTNIRTRGSRGRRLSSAIEIQELVGWQQPL